MTRFLLLLLSVSALATTAASAQIRRGTGLLAHHHGPAMFYARTISLTIRPAHRAQFLQATSAQQAKAAQEAGCRTYHYYEDPTVQNTFLLVSEWTTAAAMESYYGQPTTIAYFEQLGHWLAEPAAVHTFETVKHQITSIEVKP